MLHAPPFEMPPSGVMYVPAVADEVLVHVLQELPFARPKIAAPPTLEPPVLEVLESSHTPLAGIGRVELARRYSAA